MEISVHIFHLRNCVKFSDKIYYWIEVCVERCLANLILICERFFFYWVHDLYFSKITTFQNLDFLPFSGRSIFRNVILSKYRRWIKSKSTFTDYNGASSETQTLSTLIFVPLVQYNPTSKLVGFLKNGSSCNKFCFH